MINVTVKIDASGLNRALALGQEFSKRTPAQACNTSALEVAIIAKNTMPFVTVPRIDKELSVVTSPVIGKRGKPLKGKNNRIFGANVDLSKNPDVALAVLIIQARSNPNSRYNQLTNQRYALPGSPFKGVSREAGRAAMALLVHKMIAARHKSGSFLKAGWIPAVEILRPFGVNKYRRGTVHEDASPNYAGDLGYAQPARGGEPAAQTVILNNVGYTGKNAASFNQALQKYGAPLLQDAIDGEGRRAMQYYLDHAAKAEFFDPANKAMA